MRDLKPIMTRYNGYRFRSRTEARWAVFFDHVGMRFEYEPQGYLLDGGVPYLPDFWLPELDSFFEVKGLVADKGELDKCRSLARLSGKFIFLFVGPPALETDTGLCIWYEPLPNEVFDFETSWSECQACSTIKPFSDAQFSCHPETHLNEATIQSFRRYEHHPKSPVIARNQRLRTAVEASRSARFEYSEEGAG